MEFDTFLDTFPYDEQPLPVNLPIHVSSMCYCYYGWFSTCS
ncbi:unnamed protein product [Brassica rapa subsp. trilocularis]